MANLPKDFSHNLTGYEWIDHTADIGIRVWGANPKNLFVNAGRAMFDLICDHQLDKSGDVDSITVTGADWVDLLINWLRELLYFWTGKERLVLSMDIKSISENSVTGRVITGTFDRQRHVIGHEIKAVTYHQAIVKLDGRKWVAEVIFDV